jgi:N-acetylmuramoyl-L-alanine amidase
MGIIISMRSIKRIFIHTSDSPDSEDIGADEIRTLHTAPKTQTIEWYGYTIKGNAWRDIGYHWVVRRDGTVEEGRTEKLAGAHVYGHNSDSIGIVWIGRNKQTDEQVKALKRLVKDKMAEYNLSEKDVYGHCEVDPNKTCPNMDMNEFRRSLHCCGGGCHTTGGESASSESLLPDGPSEADINITLEEIENDVFKK